jgi:hypothetical protein
VEVEDQDGKVNLVEVVDLEVAELEEIQELQELQEQLIQVEVVVLVDQQDVVLVVLDNQVEEDQVPLLLEPQVQLVYPQRQEQTQLQHYRHQLEVVKLRHSRFLETLQLANYLLFTNPIKIII